MSIEKEVLEMTWRAIPSAAILFGGKVTYSIVTDGKWGSENTPILITGKLPQQVAEHIVSLHNCSFAAKSLTP